MSLLSGGKYVLYVVGYVLIWGRIAIHFYMSLTLKRHLVIDQNSIFMLLCIWLIAFMLGNF